MLPAPHEDRLGRQEGRTLRALDMRLTPPSRHEDLALDFGFVKIPPPAAPEIDIEKLGGPAGTTAEDADTPETAVTLPNGTANIDFAARAVPAPDR